MTWVASGIRSQSRKLPGTYKTEGVVLRSIRYGEAIACSTCIRPSGVG